MIILVPTDFSENSNNAIEYAVEMAKVTISKIVLLHVLDLHAEEQQRLIAGRKLAVISDTLKTEYPEISCSTEIMKGEVVETILIAAENHNPGLIIMETEGATNFTRLFLGTKTIMVIEKTTCPVLSLPANFAFHKPQRMIFCTNFSRDDIKGAVQFVMIAKMFNAEVIIAHVLVEPERKDIDTSLVSVFSREVSILTDYEKIKYKVLDDNTVTMGLDQLILDTNADMIALSTRKRGLLQQFFNPGITKKLSLHSNIPLLAFHIQEEID
jgi:nucleotide-binding universal stress UspA family protein